MKENFRKHWWKATMSISQLSVTIFLASFALLCSSLYFPALHQQDEAPTSVEAPSTQIPTRTSSVGHVTFAKFVQSAKNHPMPRTCPCCGYQGEQFATSHPNNREDSECPHCKARERHRVACAFVGSKEDIFKIQEPAPVSNIFRLLHFGPLPTMGEQLDITSGVDHIWLDYSPMKYTKAGSTKTIQADVSKLQLPDNFAHGIMIFHVLEHVPALDNAIGELWRVLKPNGWLMVEVPGKHIGDTKDCRNLPDDAARSACAGQYDHVWVLNWADLKSRLEQHFRECTIVTDIIQNLTSQAQYNAFQLKVNGKEYPQFFCQK